MHYYNFKNVDCRILLQIVRLQEWPNRWLFWAPLACRQKDKAYPSGENRTQIVAGSPWRIGEVFIHLLDISRSEGGSDYRWQELVSRHSEGIFKSKGHRRATAEDIHLRDSAQLWCDGHEVSE